MIQVADGSQKRFSPRMRSITITKVVANGENQQSAGWRRSPTTGGHYCLVPTPQIRIAAYLRSEEWQQKNARRFELIHKKNRGGLSPEERAEFDLLQAESARLLTLAHPVPPLGDTVRTAMQEVARSLGPDALTELQRRARALDADAFAALQAFAEATDPLARAEAVRRANGKDE